METGHPTDAFRPNIIDIEASGFGSDSYPIEIGVALYSGEKFCTLIQPEKNWNHWDLDAEMVHGISRRMLLEHGKPVRTVAKLMNRLLKGKTLYSDGWVVDKPWVNRLFFAAGIQPSFTVSALEMILNETQMTNWSATKNQVIETLSLPRHRASNDALIIQETFRLTRQSINC